ncbi:MAG: radical SAM protein [Desulfobacteraceae bacterium]|nr:radical SAM protein [Desulfobacteraceae bacterium]
MSDIDRKQVIIDHFDLLKGIEKEYAEISGGKYQAIFVTTLSWFVNVPTENILKLVRVVRREAPGTKVFFFGNSLGSWTDENKPKENDIQLVHLNNPFKLYPNNKPVDYDSLPTPKYESRRKYIFDILPFRLKHDCTWGKCRFCSLSKGRNSGYKERAANRVIEEIEELKSEYNPTMFICNGNSINGNNLLDVCTLYENFDKPWGSMARGDLTKEETVALQKAGCKIVYFGLESGSDKVLREINKGVNSRQISDFIKNLSDNNIIPAPSLFVGTPSETVSDFEKTVEFISDHKDYFDMVNVYPLAMTPASEFSFTNTKPNNETFTRLVKLINICTGLGMRVFVGEQSAEYAMGKNAYPGDVIY